VDITGTLERTPVQVGDTFTYTMSGHNNGPDVAKTVRAYVSFSQEVGFVSAVSTQGNCTYNATYSNVDCNLGDIPSGGTYSSTLTLRAISVSSLTTFSANVSTYSQQTVTTNDTHTTWLRITVCTPITVSPATLPRAIQGVTYLQTFAASGGASPYSYRTSGTLPPGLTLSATTLQGTPTASGTFAFTIVATDRNSCTGSADYTLEVIADQQPPSITAPPAATFGTNHGCGYVGSIGAATATDDVTAADELVITNDAPVVFPLGVTTVTWQAKDAAGNTATAAQNLTIVDDDAPNIAAPPAITVGANAGATYVGAIGTPVASDNCSSGATLVVTSDAPSAFPLGTTTVTWKAMDAAGHVSTATQQVTVIDDQPPSIVAPPSMTFGTNAGCTYAGAIGNAVATDNVSSGAQLVIANNAPAVFAIGGTTVTWTATDAAGNSARATQLVTVIDDDPPSISAPADVVRLADGPAGVLVPTAELGTEAASDNCGVTTVQLTGVPTGGRYPIGATTLTWTATDTAGNTSSDAQLVVVRYGTCLLYDATKAYKSGATIPLKLKLCGPDQTNLSSPSITLHALDVVGLEGNTSNGLDDAGQANPNFDFRYDEALGGYIFNLKTTGYAAGRYTLRFTVDGQAGYGADFQLR
ncbi:MAG TPA: HYR domain-containing protein, partial [Gemmatimonadaceae bacterium]|nr:HYR domain-containing protein [Gemmatimonadaceae bacterium]